MIGADYFFWNIVLGKSKKEEDDSLGEESVALNAEEARANEIANQLDELYEVNPNDQDNMTRLTIRRLTDDLLRLGFEYERK